jgi:hypothetical protein
MLQTQKLRRRRCCRRRNCGRAARRVAGRRSC